MGELSDSIYVFLMKRYGNKIKIGKPYTKTKTYLNEKDAGVEIIIVSHNRIQGAYIIKAFL